MIVVVHTRSNLRSALPALEDRRQLSVGVPLLGGGWEFLVKTPKHLEAVEVERYL
jgi:hypothetical protein